MRNLMKISLLMIFVIEPYRAQGATDVSYETNECIYGRYEEDTIFVGKNGVSENKKGNCVAKEELETNSKKAMEEPEAQSGVMYDNDKLVMDEYGLTRHQVRDWFNNGGDTVEMPQLSMTHGPGTKEYEVLQEIKRLSQAEDIRDMISIIGIAKKEPMTSISLQCMSLHLNQIDDDDEIVSTYKIRQYNIEHVVKTSCEMDRFSVVITISYSNLDNGTCIDYTDFNGIFTSSYISGRDEHAEFVRGPIKERKPSIGSVKSGNTRVEMDSKYLYPNYKNSKSCTGIISTSLGRAYNARNREN